MWGGYSLFHVRCFQKSFAKVPEELFVFPTLSAVHILVCLLLSICVFETPDRVPNNKPIIFPPRKHVRIMFGCAVVRLHSTLAKSFTTPDGTRCCSIQTSWRDGEFVDVFLEGYHTYVHKHTRCPQGLKSKRALHSSANSPPHTAQYQRCWPQCLVSFNVVLSLL